LACSAVTDNSDQNGRLMSDSAGKNRRRVSD
jgi:hypothetical protein